MPSIDRRHHLQPRGFLNPDSGRPLTPFAWIRRRRRLGRISRPNQIASRVFVAVDLQLPGRSGWMVEARHVRIRRNMSQARPCATLLRVTYLYRKKFLARHKTPGFQYFPLRGMSVAAGCFEVIYDGKQQIILLRLRGVFSV